MTQSGYTACACRDCFDVAVSSDVSKPDLCGPCADAGCEPSDGECQRPDAYGVNDEEPEPQSCPACGGDGVVLGGLGRLTWFRCRQCGIDFNTEGATTR